MKRYLRRFTFSRETADDLAQEAFLRAFAAESRHPIETPKAFLFKVAKNLALNERARRASLTVAPLGDLERGMAWAWRSFAMLPSCTVGGYRSTTARWVVREWL